MSVVSLEKYKSKLDEKPSYFGYTVFDVPLAPQAVCRTRFASDKPGQDQTLILNEAVAQLESRGIDKFERAVVSITGPGDPLARPEELVQVMTLIRQRFPKVCFAIRTLGIGGAAYAAALVQAGLFFVEIIYDGISAEFLEDIYLWIRPGRKTLPIKKAVSFTLSEQIHTLEAFKKESITVYGGITLYSQVNGVEVSSVCSFLKKHGADGAAVAYSSQTETKDSDFLDQKRKEAGAVFLVIPSLLEYRDEVPANSQPVCLQRIPKPSPDRPNVAVVSSDGIEVDLHLGQASKILIYGPRGSDDLACLLETREAPVSGGGGARWKDLSDLLSDCFVLLAASAGESPRKILSENGIRVMQVEDAIEGCVDILYGGGKKGKCKK